MKSLPSASLARPRSVGTPAGRARPRIAPTRASGRDFVSATRSFNNQTDQLIQVIKNQIRATSDVLPGGNATYTSYSDVATEAGLSRIYAGNHTRTAIDAGYTLGNNVAQFVLPHFGFHAGVTSKS